MSLTSSELEVVHDDFLELGDYSHLNGHSTDPLQNPWRPVNFDDAGGQPANGPNQQVRQPAEQPVQPENQQGNLEQQLRAVAEAMLQRVDDGTIAHNELVQDAQAEYQHLEAYFVFASWSSSCFSPRAMKSLKVFITSRFRPS